MGGFGALLSGAAGGINQEYSERREDLLTQAKRDFAEKLQRTRHSNRIDASDHSNDQAVARDDAAHGRSIERDDKAYGRAIERDNTKQERSEGLVDRRAGKDEENIRLRAELNTPAYGSIHKDEGSGLLGQVDTRTGEFHERGSARRGGSGSVSANIQELQYLTQPKEKGGMGLSTDEAMKRVYNRAGKTIDERADAYARDVIKSSMPGSSEEAEELFTASVNFYRKTYGGDKSGEKSAGKGDLQKVLTANPSWDETQAKAYLKHIGKL